MKKIKINFSDFWIDFNKYDNCIYNFLKQFYEIEISENPDYLFYSCFGFKFVKYDCIRIFFTGENVRPDFNLCDYAIGFDELIFGDRYIRWPLYLTLEYRKDLTMAKNKHITYAYKEPKNHKFCNFIYSNSLANTNRDEFFHALCNYKTVDSGGKHLNNIGIRVENKFEFQKQYKFSITYENSSTPGYTTEKIVQALAAGTVPIYWGNPLVSTEINPGCFINAHNYSTVQKLVDAVIKVDTDDDLYMKMIRTPAFKSKFLSEKDDIVLKEWFDKIFKLDPQNNKRRGNYMWEQRIENRIKLLNRIVENKLLKKILRIKLTDLY